MTMQPFLLWCGTALLLWAGISAAPTAPVMTYEHQWNVTIGGQEFGITEVHVAGPGRPGNFTAIQFGSFTHFTTFTAWQVVGLGGSLLTLVLAVVGSALALLSRSVGRKKLRTDSST